MKKKSLKSEAVDLRRSGMSYTEIMRRLPIAKSTLSTWLSSIKLTESQRRSLQTRTVAKDRPDVRRAFSDKRRQLLVSAKDRFSRVVLDANSLALVGAALYWAEGAKYEISSFANSDPDMVRLYLRWLREILHVPEDYISYKVQVYLDKGKSLAEVERFWQKVAGARKSSSFKKAIVNNRPSTSKNIKPGKSTYGTLHIRVRKASIFFSSMAALVQKLGKKTMFIEKSISDPGMFPYNAS